MPLFSQGYVFKDKTLFYLETGSIFHLIIRQLLIFLPSDFHINSLNED